MDPTSAPRRPNSRGPGIRRERAFGGEDRWIGYVSSQPGDWSASHHHGDRDTYFYVVHGAVEFEDGSDGAITKVRATEFARVPDHVVHRERTEPGHAAELVLLQYGSGPMVVNLDGPAS